PDEIPIAHVNSYSMMTNNIPGGSFRVFCGPQSAYAAESQMNKMAELLEIDPVALRLRNVLRDGGLLTTQTPIPAGVSMAEVIEAAAAESDWGTTRDTSRPMADVFARRSPFQSLPTNPGSIRRGRGFACAFKNVGFS